MKDFQQTLESELQELAELQGHNPKQKLVRWEYVANYSGILEKWQEWESYRFTGRQLEVMYLVSCGWSLQEIADHLAIHVKTVKFHLTPVFKELDLTNSRQLMLYVFNNLVLRGVE